MGENNTLLFKIPNMVITIWLQTTVLLVGGFLIGVLPTTALAQASFLNTEDGLSHRQVYSFAQDQQGRMWIGTRNGLNLFDGYSFQHFFFAPLDTNSLPGSVIHDLAIDSNGILWIATDNGLGKLDPATGQIRRFLPDKAQTSSLNNFGISHLQVLPSGKLLLSVHPSQFYEFSEGSGFHAIYPELANEGAVGDLSLDEDGSLWYLLDGKYIVKIPQPDKDLQEGKQTWRGGYYDRVAFYPNVMASGFGLHIISPEGDTVDHPVLDSMNHGLASPQFCYVDRQKHVWAAYSNGEVYSINLESQTATLYFATLPMSNFNAFFEDESGLIWVGHSYGLARLNPVPPAFENILTPKPDLLNPSVRGLIEDDSGFVYISTYDGFFKWDPINKKTEHIMATTDKRGPLGFALHNWGDYIWIASSGLLRYNKKNQEIVAIPQRKDYNGVSPKMFCFSQANDTLLWIGTDKGLARFNLKTNTIKQHTNSRLDLRSFRVWNIAKNADGSMWLSTTGGLYLMEEYGTIREHYSTDTPVQLSFREVLFAYEDADQMVWIGTRGGGLNKLNRNENSIAYYNTIHGLPNNVIYAILPSDSNVLWLSTDNGISRLDKATMSFSNYYERDGITHNEFNNCSYLKSSDGKIYFGGMAGVNAFLPNQIEPSGIRHKLYLTQVSQHHGKNDSISDSHFGLNPQATVLLSPYDRFVSFSFSLTDYFSPKSNQFQYQLQGWNERWELLGNKNTVRFNALPSGKYTFRVRAKNTNGLWAANELALPIIVQQVYYRSWWFLILVALALFAVVYLLFRFRLHQLLKMQQLRTRIASDLHDEVGSLLTQITVRTELIKSGMLSNSDQLDAVNHIATTSRAATSSMSDVLWTIDARNDRLGNLVDRMREHAEELLDPAGINFSFQNVNLPLAQNTDLEFRQNTFLLFKEAINNIVKHSAASEVLIELLNDRKFTMRITNDGISPTEAANRKKDGQGLRNMKMRAERLGGTLDIVVNSKFILTIVLNAL